MKIKQFGLILFLVVALMLALVACGDTPKDDATTEPEATQPGEQTTEPEATEPEITYTISFSDGVAAIEVKEGEAAEEPDEPSKIGYRFDGWFLGENAYDFETPVTADIALTAKWTALSYDITYVLDGGTNAADAPESYTIEDTVVLPTPTKDGFEFGGWYDEDGNLVASIPAGTTGDIELTATWTALPLVKIDMEGWGSTTDGDMAIHYAENNTINGFEYKKGTEAADGYVVPFSQTMGGYGDYILAEFMKNLHNFHYIKNEGDAHGDFFRVELDSTKTIYVKYTAGEDYNVGVMFDWNTPITAEAFELSVDFRYGEGAQFPVSFYLRDFLDKKASPNGNRVNLVTLMPNGDLDIGTDAANSARLTYKDGSGNYIRTATVLGNATPDVWHTLTFHFEVNEDDDTMYYVKIKLDGQVISGDSFLSLEVKNLRFDGPATGGTEGRPAANCLMPFGGGGGGATAINNKIADGELEDFKCYYDFDNVKIIAVELDAE